MNRPRVSIIVAQAANRVIGRDNALPWRLPEDLAHFKRTTMGKPVIMGRKTFESIGRALPGRRNIVLTSRGDWSHQGCERAESVAGALALCADADEVFVIGGSQVYDQALPLADRLVVTQILRDVEGDTHFPVIDPQIWCETERSAQSRAEDPQFRFDFITYERKLS